MIFFKKQILSFTTVFLVSAFMFTVLTEGKPQVLKKEVVKDEPSVLSKRQTPPTIPFIPCIGLAANICNGFRALQGSLCQSSNCFGIGGSACSAAALNFCNSFNSEAIGVYCSSTHCIQSNP
ncbi:MAG: hypothetical protein EXX96DRAFT_331282 [Benjaminiella poitrasii]|nr:MAG: hypothetical protein EXX96DRAFT_331282 [Benjaminiella poitrasii]